MSSIGVVVQAESAIAPRWPWRVIAEAWAKLTEPKSASGTVWQLPPTTQLDGASTIHSADDVSGEDIRRKRIVLRPVVRLRMATRTSWPRTVTLAVMRSPGRARIETVRSGRGTSSYQAE